VGGEGQEDPAQGDETPPRAAGETDGGEAEARTGPQRPLDAAQPWQGSRAVGKRGLEHGPDVRGGGRSEPAPVLPPVAERHEQGHRVGAQRAGAFGIDGRVDRHERHTALVLGADRLRHGLQSPAVASAGRGDEHHHGSWLLEPLREVPRGHRRLQAFFVLKPRSGYAGQ